MTNNSPEVSGNKTSGGANQDINEGKKLVLDINRTLNVKSTFFSSVSNNL